MYVVLYETLTMLEKKYVVGEDGSEFTLDAFLATSIFTRSDLSPLLIPQNNTDTLLPLPKSPLQVPQWVPLIFETYCQLPNNLTGGTALSVEASVSQTKANHLRPQRTGYELLIATLDQWTRIAGKLLILFFFFSSKGLWSKLFIKHYNTRNKNLWRQVILLCTMSRCEWIASFSFWDFFHLWNWHSNCSLKLLGWALAFAERNNPSINKGIIKNIYNSNYFNITAL